MCAPTQTVLSMALLTTRAVSTVAGTLDAQVHKLLSSVLKLLVSWESCLQDPQGSSDLTPGAIAAHASEAWLSAAASIGTTSPAGA